MAAKRYHIGRNGEPAVCHAKGKCPLGGVSGTENHFTNYQDALKRSEELYEAKFITTSKSATMSRKFAETAAPLIQGDITAMRASATAQEAVDVFNNVARRRDIEIPETTTGKIGRSTYPLVPMRRSANTKKTLGEMFSNYHSASEMQIGLGAEHPAQAVATIQKSLDNVNADLARVKTLLGENTMNTKPAYTRADVFYATSTDKGHEKGMVMYTTTRFDTERLSEDLEKAGYKLADVEAVSQTWSDAKIRDAMIAKIRAASPELVGRKGVNETLDAAMAASGLFTKSVDWSPNSKSVNAVAEANADAVVSRVMPGDIPHTTSNSGELRQMFCELSEQKAALEQRQMEYGQKALEAVGDGVFTSAKGNKVEVDGVEFSGRTSWTFEPANVAVDPSLPADERARALAERDEQIASFIREDLGGDPADFKTGRRSVTADSLRAFSAAHPDARIGYWKYAKPQQNFRYRNVDAENNSDVRPYSKKIFRDVKFTGEFE